MANPFFNAAYYLANNPDIAAAGHTLATAEMHYLKYGTVESLATPAPVRAPNAWFDVKTYLSGNPDLTSHGVTAASALAHYRAYGLNENRSPAANVKPADFTYAHYAASNADLRAAFGIIDPLQLTAQHQHLLLAHYLAYGSYEGRAGVDSTAAGSFFAPAAAVPATPGATPAAPPVVPPLDPVTPPVPPGQTIVVDPSGSYTGTSADDIFTANKANLNLSILDGEGGTDTLQLSMDGAPGSTTVALTSIENIAVALTGENTLINTGGPGVTALKVSGASGSALDYRGDKVSSVTLENDLRIGLTFTQSTVTGDADSLHVGLNAGVQGALLASHIETFDIAFGVGASQLSLSTGPVESSALGAVLNGGHAGDAMNFILTVTPGAASQTVTVDGSTAVGDISVTLNGLGAANAVITGGAGDDHLTAMADVSHDTTLVGGAGNDTLTGSAGIDTMTGGDGDDTFVFGDGPAAHIRLDGALLHTDRITDFSHGDKISFAGLAPVLLNPLISNVVSGVEHGVVIFKPGFLGGILNNVTDIVAAIAADMILAGPGAGANLLFNDGNASYFLHTGVGLLDSGLVKLELAGVPADISQITADAMGIHYTAGPA